MSTNTPDTPLRAAARLVVAMDTGAITLPPDMAKSIRDAVANAAPKCTPEQIANNECPTA